MSVMETETDSLDQPVSGEIHTLLHAAIDREASDVHLAYGYPVTYRVHGRLEPVGEVLDGERIFRMIEAILPERLRGRLGSPLTSREPRSDSERSSPSRDAQEKQKNFDFSVSLQHGGVAHRFRTNIYLAQSTWCASLRHVPNQIPTLAWMGFPEGLAQYLTSYTNGLVIITGVTGSGKSTTLAALIDLLNRKGGYRVITVEEPIEYVHKPISSTVVTQREVGRDVDSFYDGLKYGLRQDPDIILVGEIRDRETAQMALSAAETGHLIFATLHTRDAKGAVTRFVDLFPHDAQEDVRSQLSLSLRSVVSQHLLPSARGEGKRALALEIMHVNNPVRAGIRWGKIDSIESAIQTGKRDGMMTLDEDLERLLMAGKITRETALRFAKIPGGLRR